MQVDCWRDRRTIGGELRVRMQFGRAIESRRMIESAKVRVSEV